MPDTDDLQKLAVIITFGCGFCLLYVANRLLGKDQ